MFNLEKDEDGAEQVMKKEILAQNPDEALDIVRNEMRKMFGFDYLKLHCTVIGVRRVKTE